MNVPDKFAESMLLLRSCERLELRSKKQQLWDRSKDGLTALVF